LPCTRKFNELHFEVPQPGNTCDFSSRLLWEVLRASRLWREAPKAPPSLVEDSVHDSAGDGFVDCFWSPVGLEVVNYLITVTVTELFNYIFGAMPAVSGAGSVQGEKINSHNTS